MTVYEDSLHHALSKLDDLQLAAVARELAFILAARDVHRWRLLLDVADELTDRATLSARSTLTALLTPLVTQVTARGTEGDARSRRQRSRRPPGGPRADPPV